MLFLPFFRIKARSMLADDLGQKWVQVAEIEIRAKKSPAGDFGLDQFFKDPPYGVLFLRDL